MCTNRENLRLARDAVQYSLPHEIIKSQLFKSSDQIKNNSFFDFLLRFIHKMLNFVVNRTASFSLVKIIT